MYCTRCGAELADGTRFCDQCGAALNRELPAVSAEPEPAPSPPPPSPRSSLDDHAVHGPPSGASKEPAPPAPSANGRPSIPAPGPGDLIGGRFKLRFQIGRGRTGTVFRAVDQTSQNECAVKIYHPHLTESPAARQRLLRALEAAASLDHPGIVRVLGCGETASGPFIATELLAGLSLREWLDRVRIGGKTVPVELAGRIFVAIVDALDAARETTLHGDLKPENVFLIGEEPDVEVKLLDFGVNAALDAEGGLPGHSPLRSQRYAAPETRDGGGGGDSRADIYSAGGILFELLTNRSPEMSGGRVTLHRQGLSPSWDALVADLMQREPNPRPPNARRIRERLEHLLDRVPPPSAHSAQTPPRAASVPSPGSRSEAPATSVVAGAAPSARSVPERDVAPAATAVAQSVGRGSLSEDASVMTPAEEESFTLGRQLAAGASAPKSRTPLLVVALVAVGVVVAGVAWTTTRRQEGAVSAREVAQNAPRVTPEPVRPPASWSPGSIVVRVSPASYAVLDNVQHPVEGRRLAETHTFRELEPRQYRIKVWRDGYFPETRPVSVLEGQTSEVSITLSHQ